MGIQAIETRYKGYRFRSRLEARWAVAFDEMGWDWQYEPEGYVVDGRPYLPDFFVGGPLDAFVEIKPTYPECDIPVCIYMAGKMPYRNWRYWRPGDLQDVDIERPITSVQSVTWKNFFYMYSGPYGDDSTRDHGYKHGGEECGQYDKEIFGRAIHGIDTAEVVVAIIDAPDCYGTLVEIGYARASGKKVFVAFVDKSVDGPLDVYNSELAREMWFAATCATDHGIFLSHEDAIDWALSSAGAKEREEIRLIRGVAKATGKSGCVAYGVPGEHMERGGVTIPLSDKAIQRARSARFEFGEKG